MEVQAEKKSVTFIGKISKQGKMKLIIIPKDRHDEVKKMKDVRVTVEIEEL